MKKLVAILLAVLMMSFMLAGCTSTPTSAQDSTTAPADNTEVADATDAPASRLDDIKAAGKIVMATSPDFAPSEFIDLTKGQDAYVGSDIELGKYIADQLGVELEIQAMDFSAVQAAVTTGAVDMAISGFAYTDERAESMGLSDFYNKDEDDGQGLLILKENADKFATAESFSGVKVAAQNASLQYNLLTKQLPDATVEPITNLNDAVMMLITGKVDALAVSGTNGQLFIDNYPELAMSAFKFDYTSEGNVLAVPKGETELLDAINAILADVNEQGLYAQWKADATTLAKSLGVEVNE